MDRNPERSPSMTDFDNTIPDPPEFADFRAAVAAAP